MSTPNKSEEKESPPDSKKSSPGGGHRGHNLPQIASMTHSRVAVSKSSRKSDAEASTPDKPFANLVSMEDLEKVEKPKEPETPADDHNKPPSSIPTPPSDKSSNDSPPKSTPTKVEIAAATSSVEKKDPKLPTPIKIRIRKSPEEGKLMSSMDEEILASPELKPFAEKPARHSSGGKARTKENIKKKLLKKKEAQAASSPASVESQESKVS